MATIRRCMFCGSPFVFVPPIDSDKGAPRWTCTVCRKKIVPILNQIKERNDKNESDAPVDPE